MSDPVVMVVHAIPKAGQSAAVLDILKELVPIVHEEEGCGLYSLNVHENGDIYFIEKWSSAEMAQQHSRSSAILPTLAERVSPLLESMPEVVELTPVPAGSTKGAL